MPTVSVNTYTHSVTYVADNILKSFKDIILMSGLNPEIFSEKRESNLRAIRTWIESRHLERVILEIFDPRTNKLVTRWDIDVEYNWSSGDGSFYTDTDQLRYHILKAGLAPSQARYSLIAVTSPGEPSVPGWSDCTMRSTDGMVRQSLGSTIQHNGLGGNSSYWRKS